MLVAFITSWMMKVWFSSVIIKSYAIKVDWFLTLSPTIAQLSFDTPSNSLIDSIMSPKVKITEG